MVRIHLVPSLGRTRLDRLNLLQLQSLYRAKLDVGLSPRTVRIIHTTLHKSLRQAVRWSLIPRNVTEAVGPTKGAKKRNKSLDEEQVKGLLKAAEEDRFSALYVLAITSGIRSGELLRLRWEDVNLQTGTLQVKRSIFNGRTEAPKTSKGRRSIRMTRGCLEALEGHPKASEWVFCSKAGTPMSVHNLHRRSWKPLLRRAGLPADTRFHDL